MSEMDIEQWYEAMPVEGMRRRLATLQTQMESTRAEMRYLTTQLDLWDTMDREGKLGRGGEQPMFDVPQPNTPPSASDDVEGEVSEPTPVLRGREAIRAVVREIGKSDWRIGEMVSAISSRGWPGNAHSVGVNLSRMARDGEFTKPDLGLYRASEELLGGGTTNE